MPPADTIAHWQKEISQHLPHLSRPQAAVLALWSYGIVLTKSCGITTVAAFLACLLGWSKGNLRQRLREWCYDADDKKGEQRTQLEPATCFAPLLGWIITRWASGEHSLALALDATTLSDRFIVTFHQCAISRLRHPGGLADHDSPCPRIVAPCVGALVTDTGSGSATGVACDCAGGSGVVRELAL